MDWRRAFLRAALSKSQTPVGAAAPAAPAALAFDTAAIDKIMGRAGKANGSVYQFSIPRAEQVTESGMPAPATMGTATAINFQSVGAGRAATTGDFVLTAAEVPLVMRALRDNGIDVTALHNHMLNDQPRMFFMHFWGVGDALQLARGLSTAVRQTNSR